MDTPITEIIERIGPMVQELSPQEHGIGDRNSSFATLDGPAGVVTITR